MSTTRWDLAAILLLFVVALLILWQRHRHAMKALDVARYHANADLQRWGKAVLLGRKEIRWCPDCGAMAHSYKAQELHHEDHMYVWALEDRITELERIIAEARGGGPAEEPVPVPWDGLSGELVEHAGAVDVAPDELEARADEPEPEPVLAFREKYGELFRS